MRNPGVVFTGKDEVSVQPVQSPGPGPGELLIQTTRTLISAGTECICLQRKFSPGTHWHAWVQYPFYPGYCGVGKVREAGPGVEGFEPGARVALWSKHLQFATAAADRAVRVPETVGDEEAAWYPMAAIAQHGFRLANVQLGETVVVVGLGMLGQLVVQYARLAGAREVIAIDPAAPRLELARRFGATRGVAVPVAEALDVVRDITGERLAEVLFDMTGHPEVFAASQGLLGNFGRLVLIGDTGAPEQQRLTSDCIKKNLQILGAHQSLAAGRPWNHARMGELFLQYVQEGRMNVKDLISHRFAVEKAPEAYDLLTTRRSEAMGVVLQFGEA